MDNYYMIYKRNGMSRIGDMEWHEQIVEIRKLDVRNNERLSPLMNRMGLMEIEL